MKRFAVRIALMCLVVLMIIPAIASAEIKANRFSVSPFVGGVMLDDNYDTGHGFMGGLRFGYDYTRSLGVEASLAYIGADADDDDGGTARAHAFRVEGLYHFIPDSVVVPHVALGLGDFGIYYSGDGDDKNLFAIDYGVGLSYFVAENLALRGDVRHVYMPGDGNSNIEYAIGLTYYLGGSATEPEKDSDRDGVLDSKDRCPNTPRGDKVDSVGCTIKEKVSITLLVEFDTSKSDVKPQYHDEIKRVADFMQKYPDSNAVIEGHTDSVGDHEYNVNLSKERAESVMRYLIDNFGVSATRIRAEGYGPDRPVADNETVEGRQKNRRVMAVFEGMK